MNATINSAPSTTPLRLAAITFLMGLAQLVIASDFSMVGVALPTIGRDLGIQPTFLSWVVSANATVFAGFLIVGGRLTDAIGHRRCLGLGMILFVAGSLLSALSTGMWMLIMARALQGLGSALVAPASFSLINAFLPQGPARHRALGVFAVMQGMSVIVGLVLGGFLTTSVGWRAVFLINVPIVAACLAMTAYLLPNAPSAAKGALDDIGGALLIAIATGLLLLALSAMGAKGPTSVTGLGLLAASAVAFAAFAALEARHPSPLIPLGLLKAENLAGGGLAIMGLIAGFGGAFVLLSLYLQNGLHVSAAVTGLSMTPIALATMAAGPCVPIFMRRWSHRTVALAGLGLQIVSLLLLALAAPSGAYLTMVAPLIFAAVFGSTSAFVALAGLALARVAPDQQGAASGFIFTGQQIGLPVGVAVTLAAFQPLSAGAAGGGLAAYGRVFPVPAMLAALGLAAVLFLTRSASISDGIVSPNFTER